MKKYRLLKSLPNASEGSIFTLTKMMVNNIEGEVMICQKYSDFFEEERSIIIPKRDILDFEKWFEPYEAKYFYHVDHWLGVERKEIRPTGFGLSGPEGRSNLKAAGNYFETQEEAETYLKWLKARAVLLEDAKMSDGYDNGYEVYVDVRYKSLHLTETHLTAASEIRFSNEEDALNSIKNHEKEWKIYLGVE